MKLPTPRRSVLPFAWGCWAALAAACRPGMPAEPKPETPSVFNAKPAVPASSIPTELVVPEDSTHHPLEVQWIVRRAPQAGHPATNREPLVLVARVVSNMDLKIPLRGRLQVPPGVNVIAGPMSWSLATMAPGGVQEFEYTLTYGTVPPTDLRFLAEAVAQDFGVHLNLPYRFGRAELQGPRPVATGTDLVLGGHHFGRAIRAQ